MKATGYQARFLSVSHLQSLKDGMDRLYSQGLIHDRIYSLLRQFHNFDLPAGDFQPKSILVVASPSPQVKVHFLYDGRKVPIIIPPTYIDYVTEPVLIEARINKLIGPAGYQAARVQSLPEKLVAAVSGLSQYGRNNLAYVQGMGSMCLLSAYYTDLPWDEGLTTGISFLAACMTCRACIANCPTGSITAHQDMIKAGDCLTYYNEFTGMTPFPVEIDSSIHHCLIGCMKCQAACPQNRNYLGNVRESEEFHEADTLLLLQNHPIEDLPPEVVAKLQRINFAGFYYPFLSRNLQALLDR